MHGLTMSPCLLRVECSALNPVTLPARVFCRVRKDTREGCVFTFPTDTELMVRKLHGGEARLEYDKTYGPNTQQEQVQGKAALTVSADGGLTANLPCLRLIKS